jgi:hypothetical protein
MGECESDKLNVCIEEGTGQTEYYRIRLQEKCLKLEEEFWEGMRRQHPALVLSRFLGVARDVRVLEYLL